MLLAIVPLLAVCASSLADQDIQPIEVIEIEKELSREVEEEFAGKANHDELGLLKKQFASSHFGNATSLISISTELDFNLNNTDLFEGDIDLTP